MFDIQLGRRNLSSFQRIAVVEKKRAYYKKKAKEKQAEYHGNQYDKKSGITPNLVEFQNNRTDNETNSKLAKLAGVGKETYRMGAKILNSDNEELKKRVLSGETSISAGYKELTQSKEVLKDLIETNIRQRGIGNPNPIKLGRCIKELERIYGIRDGSTNKQGTIVGENFSFTQKDLANELGLDIRTMQNYKKLTELVPELQDWVETGILAPITV